jgi:hypothetical protein
MKGVVRAHLTTLARERAKQRVHRERASNEYARLLDLYDADELEQLGRWLLEAARTKRGEDK